VTQATLPYTIRVGAGEPALVFVHGFGCSHADWQAQLVHFAPTHSAIACDLRGHGATPGQPAECSIETYGADVAELLRALDLSKAVLVGHSMGCRVVLQAARDAPGRVAGIVLVVGWAAAHLYYYNMLVDMEFNAQEAWAQVETQWQRRYNIQHNVTQLVLEYARLEVVDMDDVF